MDGIDEKKGTNLNERWTSIIMQFSRAKTFIVSLALVEINWRISTRAHEIKKRERNVENHDKIVVFGYAVRFYGFYAE